MDPETYGPDAPIRLWTYTYWHPGYRNHVTLDTGAVTREHAFEKARRFMLREQRRMRRAGIALRGIVNHPNALRLEMPACSS